MKNIMYLLLGASTATLTMLYIQNKDEIQRKMYRMKKEGMRTINKVKSLF